MRSESFRATRPGEPRNAAVAEPSASSKAMQGEAYLEVLRRKRLAESLRKAQDRADTDVRLFVRSGIVALLAVSSALFAMIWLLMPDI